MAKEIPVLDPLMIIQRFANVLDFDDNDIGSIVLSATRLVNRMKADWIDMGRRPSGLCAAGKKLSLKKKTKLFLFLTHRFVYCSKDAWLQTHTKRNSSCRKNM